MTVIAPFRGLRPAAGREGDVCAPPYDVLDAAEARRRAEGRPWSFLHVSRAEIDLPEGVSPHDPAVYAKAGENIRRMIAAGVLEREADEVFYVYRLIRDGHAQTGLVAAASVAAYDENRIRRHEHTRPAKEDDRVRQVKAVGAHTGPVMLAAPEDARFGALLTEAAAGRPDMDTTADDGVRHTLWTVRGPQRIARFLQACEALPALYIADGHHRAAAASRVCAERAAREPENLTAPWRRFLGVIFPAGQLRILDYNRVLRDLNGLSAADFLAAVGDRLSVSPADGPVRPQKRGVFGMYLGGRWFRLETPAERIPDKPPEGLDVNILEKNVLSPVLGVHDQRTDARIDFVGGARGLDELERRVDSGEMAVAFSLRPPSMDDLMRVADAGEVMPTKSTWFEPKLADGLISLPLE